MLPPTKPALKCTVAVTGKRPRRPRATKPDAATATGI